VYAPAPPATPLVDFAAVRRVPLLSGTRVLLASAPDDARVIAPPPPAEPIADVGAAVRSALRFPLAGEPLEALVPRSGGRATIVVEPPALPLPGAERDPRQEAITAVVDELERLGLPSGYQTILVAGGLARRSSGRELEALVQPDLARRFPGRVVVHGAGDPDLAPLADFRVNRALFEATLVVTVTAAETVLHGGPAALLGAADAEALRAAGASSLVETRGSRGWELAVALERELSRRAPVLGVSLALNLPQLAWALRGYPHDPAVVERLARSSLRRAFRLVPGAARAWVLRSFPVELTAASVFAGSPSVAHAEALIRGTELRSTPLDGPLDAVCLGIPRTTPYVPRERPNPLLAAYLGLGLALRLWRDSFPVAEGGTAVLLHRFHRHFEHPTQQPYRALFRLAAPLEPAELERAEREAASDERTLRDYRAGRSCHPLLPFAHWDACRPALDRLGHVLVAGCRDAVAARQLGFVPVHNLGAALAMTQGWSERAPRIGFLLSPPYFPLTMRA
jgi:hypothetical protein